MKSYLDIENSFDKKKIGASIKTFRVEKYTAVEFSKIIGVSDRTLRRIENNGEIDSIELLSKITTELGIDMLMIMMRSMDIKNATAHVVNHFDFMKNSH
jgi:transcriptional regulator with XRE-family HTH domain